MRAAAVDTFLRELKARGSGDLNGVVTTLNDGGLCRETLRHWLVNRWIVVAPNSPLVALTGPGFTRELTLRAFCGEEFDSPPEERAASIPIESEGSKTDENP